MRWIENAVSYQVYPRSFADGSFGGGILASGPVSATVPTDTAVWLRRAGG
jgi:hypothetical protein